MPPTPPLVTVCIDDTDRPGSRSTARLARSIIELLAPRYRCHSLTTHAHLPAIGQSQDQGGNRSACMRFEDRPELVLDELVHEVRCLVLEDLLEGSHPGLCAGRRIPDSVQDFGRRSSSEPLSPEEAHRLAGASGLTLEGLAGTGRGVVGALAGAGLAAAGGPGTYLWLVGRPLDLNGLVSPRKLAQLGIEHLLDARTGQPLPLRPLWVDRELHPAMVDARPVVYVQTTESGSLAFVHQGE